MSGPPRYPAPTLAGDEPGSSLPPEALIRYSRHISIPEVGLEGQNRLRAASVLIIGAGGLGSPAALYLTAAGVGRVGLVDFDAIELSNLQRQILFDTDSVGSSKLDAARQRLSALNPHVSVETCEARFSSSNALEILEGWDLVIDGSDNFPTRYLVNDACLLSGIPFVYGAIHRFEGQVSLFGAPDGPCYRCLFAEPPPPGLVPTCAEAGVLGVLPGLVGTIQATEALKWILRKGEPLVGRLMMIDALAMEFRELRIRRDPGCAACGEEPTIDALIDYERFCGIESDAPGAQDARAARPSAESSPAAGASPSREPNAEHEATSPMPLEIDVHELASIRSTGEPYQLVDVREPYEWEICNLEGLGARLVPLAEFAERTEELDRETPLVVHCRTGPRSARAVEYLRSLGFENATNLRGGILAWAAEMDPTMPSY